MCVCMCDMNTRILKHTHERMYIIIIIKLYCRAGGEFDWYSTVKCDYCVVVSFFINLSV